MSKIGKKKKTNFNPIAKLLAHGLFKLRVIKNKKQYNRKKKYDFKME